MPIFLLGVDPEGIGIGDPDSVGSGVPMHIRISSLFYALLLAGWLIRYAARGKSIGGMRRDKYAGNHLRHGLSLYPFGVSPYRCVG